MIGIITGGVVFTALAILGRGYIAQRTQGRTGPNSRAILTERVVAVRTDTRTNHAVRVGRRALIQRVLSRLHTT